MNPIYKFTINGIEVHPIYKDDLAKEWEMENSQRFYRAKLSGKLTFVGPDFDTLNAASFETEFLFNIDISTDLGLSWNSFFKGKFMKTDAEWNLTDRSVSVQPQTVDEYESVLAGMEKEYNLIPLSPVIDQIVLDKRPLIQIYIPGTSVVSCFLGGTWWEQSAEVVNDKNALVNKYFFSLCNLLKEVRITVNGTPSDASGIYVGRMSKSGSVWSGDMYKGDSNYVLRFRQEPIVNLPWYYTVAVQLIRTSDSKVLFQYSSVSQSEFENLDFTMTAQNGATGSALAEMATYSVFARYITDNYQPVGSTIHAYPIPPDDLVDNNRNYRYAIGYAIDVAFLSNNFSTDPTPWGRTDLGDYFNPPYTIWGQKFFPIARSTWRYASLWFGFSLFDWILEEKWRQKYTLRDANPISSVISVLLKEFAPEITHEATPEYSQFLYGNQNPISWQKFTLLLTQKTNLTKGNYDQPAQKAPITLQQVFNMLRDCFRVYWFIEDGKLKLEHAVYFINGGSYTSNITGIDATESYAARNRKNWDFATEKWTFDKPDMPERYEFSWMDDVTQPFEGYPIEVLSKYVTAGKIEKLNISGFTSDVDYMILNPEAINNDGFALFAAVGGGLFDPTASGTEYNTLLDLQGNTVPYVGAHTTPYIPIGSGRIRINKCVRVCFYSSDYSIEFISEFTANPLNSEVVIDVPLEATLMRADALASNWETFSIIQQYALPYVTREMDGVDLIMQNGYASFMTLVPTYYIYDLPARQVKINDSEMYLSYAERSRSQKINYPFIEDINPNQLVKTSIGTGKIKKLSVNLSSGMNAITLKHDNE